MGKCQREFGNRPTAEAKGRSRRFWSSAKQELEEDEGCSQTNSFISMGKYFYRHQLNEAARKTINHVEPVWWTTTGGQAHLRFCEW